MPRAAENRRKPTICGREGAPVWVSPAGRTSATPARGALYGTNAPAISAPGVLSARPSWKPDPEGGAVVHVVWPCPSSGLHSLQLEEEAAWRAAGQLASEGAWPESAEREKNSGRGQHQAGLLSGSPLQDVGQLLLRRRLRPGAPPPPPGAPPAPWLLKYQSQDISILVLQPRNLSPERPSHLPRPHSSGAAGQSDTEGLLPPRRPASLPANPRLRGE